MKSISIAVIGLAVAFPAFAGVPTESSEEQAAWRMRNKAPSAEPAPERDKRDEQSGWRMRNKGNENVEVSRRHVFRANPEQDAGEDAERNNADEKIEVARRHFVR